MQTLLTLSEGENRTGVTVTVARPAGPVQGLVTDGEGHAIAGATVDVYLEHAGWRGSGFQGRAFTDDAGHFEIGDLPAGTHTLGIEHPVYGRVWQRGVAPGGAPLTVRLKQRDATPR
jgi:hypothetical protein